MWDQSVRDYGVLAKTLRDPNDPVEEYQSTISRDKSDVFIASLASQLLYASVVAQNAEQEVDRLVSRVSSSLLEWAMKNDGSPSESGQQKNSRYIHKAVVEGTVHVLDVVTKDGLESELIPNEELYIGNFWQPDIQKQGTIIRARLNLLYDEAEAMLGDLPNWKYVQKGGWTELFFNNAPFTKDGFQGIEWDNRVQLLYVWKTATKRELEELKKDGKVAKNCKRACFYNIIANNVPMYPVDNLSPFKHGFFPISKGKFTEFAKPEFYYGNSLPNKVMEDKRWLDAWKTLLRYKAKLGVLKPSLVMGGTLEEDILLPSKMTPVGENIKIVPIEGVSDGVSNADLTMLQMAEGEIDRGTVSPQMAGQSSDRAETARAATIQASTAARMLDAVSQQIAFFQASRSFPILLALFQFIPKRDLKKIAIPDQTLSDGTRGTFEVLFQDPGTLTEMEALTKSFELRALETEGKKKGSPREVAYVNPGYLKDLKFYVSADASTMLQDKGAARLQKFQADMALFLSNPDLFDRKTAARQYLRINEYPDELLAPESNQPQMPQDGAPPGAAPVAAAEERATAPDAEMNMISQAVTGEPMPSLPVNG
jgi:hypothetical protein